ncbi:MAG: GNAT family N-acetyltransferase [Caldilineaceae bacterium]
MNLQISTIQPGDGETIIRVHHRAFAEWATQLPVCYRYQPLQIEEVHEWLEHPNRTIWVARQSDTVIGYAACRPATLPGEQAIRVLHFPVTHADWGQSRIAVAPEWQGHGVATRLLQTILADFTTTDGQVVTAYSYNFNRAATRLFTKLGFVNRPLFYLATYSEVEPFTYDAFFAQLDLTRPLPIVPLHHEVAVRPMQADDSSAIQCIFRESAPFAFGGDPSAQELATWLADENADIR